MAGVFRTYSNSKKFCTISVFFFASHFFLPSPVIPMSDPVLSSDWSKNSFVVDGKGIRCLVQHALIWSITLFGASYVI